MRENRCGIRTALRLAGEMLIILAASALMVGLAWYVTHN